MEFEGAERLIPLHSSSCLVGLVVLGANKAQRSSLEVEALSASSHLSEIMSVDG